MKSRLMKIPHPAGGMRPEHVNDGMVMWLCRARYKTSHVFRYLHVPVQNGHNTGRLVADAMGILALKTPSTLSLPYPSASPFISDTNSLSFTIPSLRSPQHNSALGL